MVTLGLHVYGLQLSDRLAELSSLAVSLLCVVLPEIRRANILALKLGGWRYFKTDITDMIVKRPM